jgi:membrane protein DedA with SNARE-associated domain
MLTFLSLMFRTLVSEDLACVAADLLIQRGQVEASSAVLACTLGIFAGDVGLWAIGRACDRGTSAQRADDALARARSG